MYALWLHCNLFLSEYYDGSLAGNLIAVDML